MGNNTLKELKQQHFDNYRKAILENITNNTNVLVNEDIMSLIGKPPLDSMDSLRTKLLDLAKRNKIVLNTEELSKILEDYRQDLTKCCQKIKKVRIDELSSVVEHFSCTKDTDTIILYKKDFVSVNKEIKKIMKEQLISSFDTKIISKIHSVFQGEMDSALQDKFVRDFSKYGKGAYQRQLLENFDIKILVKDTTLMNGVKEQSERYLFTLNNSRLLNDME